MRYEVQVIDADGDTWFHRFDTRQQAETYVAEFTSGLSAEQFPHPFQIIEVGE